MNNIYQKVHALQAEIGAIEKDSTNPFFKSKYFDINTLIASLKPLLEKHKLVILQPLGSFIGSPDDISGSPKNTITTIIIDIDDPAQQISSTTLLPDNADPQKMGAIITYFRRYALQSMLLLQAEDDDGNSAKPESNLQKLDREFDEAGAKKEFVIKLDPTKPRKTCVDCNQEFNPKEGTESWSTKCYPCYKKNGSKRVGVVTNYDPMESEPYLDEESPF